MQIRLLAKAFDNLVKFKIYSPGDPQRSEIEPFYRGFEEDLPVER